MSQIQQEDNKSQEPPSPPGFAAQLAAALPRLAPAEYRTALFFRDHPDEVVVASAWDLGSQIGVSDSVVIRTARSLGYAGLADLRRDLIKELRSGVTPATRMTKTIDNLAAHGVGAALALTVETHRTALDGLCRDIPPVLFEAAVGALAAATRVQVFGIGPSNAMAAYFVTQLNRFGRDATAMTHTGLLQADDLHRLRQGDLVVILAYSRVYRELDSLLLRIQALGLKALLLSDTLGSELSDRVDLVLPVARGRSDMFSMHTATLALLEALLVGLAIEKRDEVVPALAHLNGLRRETTGGRMDLPVAGRRPDRKVR